MPVKSLAERIAALETQHEDVIRWREAGHEEWLRSQEETRKAFADINRKLDELISLRNKAAGAVLLAGSGIVGAVVTFWGWLKGSSI